MMTASLRRYSELIKFLRPAGRDCGNGAGCTRSGSACALTVTEPIHTSWFMGCWADGIQVFRYADRLCEAGFFIRCRADRKPDLVVGGINHGDNSSVNLHYSGTPDGRCDGMPERSAFHGFSLCNHEPNADFEPAGPYIREIARLVLEKGLPPLTCLNVNFPIPKN